MERPSLTLTHQNYDVAILCALRTELLAVRTLFEEEHHQLKTVQQDTNHYSLGRMGEHYVVATCLPSGEYGTNAASAVMVNMQRSFPEVECILLVGIGGGVPSSENDIRLGDVVVSHPNGSHPAVKQYDMGKILESGMFQSLSLDFRVETKTFVLLDEADVFLEERTHQDLQRNALVSVFLRVIEYYDGILVLTSNRIGTFDEAFKSRVQLIVHYPKLGKSERRRIWDKFIRSLRGTQVNANVEELEERAEALSEIELNGREIRNTIQTATLLAQYDEQQLQYEHLMNVISVSVEFKDYLRDRFGHDDEERVERRGIR